MANAAITIEVSVAWWRRLACAVLLRFGARAVRVAEAAMNLGVNLVRDGVRTRVR